VLRNAQIRPTVPEEAKPNFGFMSCRDKNCLNLTFALPARALFIVSLDREHQTRTNARSANAPAIAGLCWQLKAVDLIAIERPLEVHPYHLFLSNSPVATHWTAFIFGFKSETWF